VLLAAVVRVGNPAQGLWAENERWRLVEELRLAAVGGDRYRLRRQRIAVDPLTRPFIQRMREQGVDIDPRRVPATKPYFSWFFVDDAERLWVRVPGEDGDDATRLDVFDAGGRYLGQLVTQLPLSAHPAPVVRGAHLYALTQDKLEVPYVVRMRIEGLR
jgi:hypothetical protein